MNYKKGGDNMFDNAMFLKVLADIGITVNDEIKDGKFSKLVI